MFRLIGLALVGVLPGWPLRRALYRALFGYRFGRGARIAAFNVVDARKLSMAEGARIRGAGNVFLNLHVLEMGAYATIGGPRFGGNRVRGTANKRGYPCASLRLGPCAIVELEHYFDVCADVEIGANTVIGGLRSVFFTHTFHEAEFKPIRVGRDVYVGSNCKFQMGVSVADGCVVGMGAVVVKDVEVPGALAAGVPAKVVREDAGLDTRAAFALRRRPYFDGERVLQPVELAERAASSGGPTTEPTDTHAATKAEG